MKTILLSVLSLFVVNILAQHQIGHYQVTFQDPERGNRDIQTEIYYPATTAGESTPAAMGQFPVIVFGHGFVMAWDAYENLWEEFVPNGYIMVFPRTEGNAFSTDHQEFGWDLEYLVTLMQIEGVNASAPINGIVASNTALMGHSMGGGATFLAADSLCNSNNINLKTLVGLAPAESSTNGVSSISSALNVTVPSLIMSGSQDGVTPPVDHHIPMYDNLASDCKTFIDITGGAHCYFANSNAACDFGEGTSSSGISIDRLEQHDITFSFVNNWLDYTLKSDCVSFQMFQDSVVNSTRVVTNQICATNLVSSISENSGILTSSVSGTSYQWYLDGVAISGANNITHTAVADGNYTVEVTFNSGCPTLSQPFPFSSSTGINSLSESIKVYPNPTTGIVNLPKVYNVDIYNVAGQLIDKLSQVSAVNITNFENGIYFLKIENSFVKIIKK
jgi:pimeloyl-ACP methyl ester carboxylesterase